MAVGEAKTPAFLALEVTPSKKSNALQLVNVATSRMSLLQELVAVAEVLSACIRACMRRAWQGTQCMWSKMTLELWQKFSLLADNATAFCARKVSVEAPVLPEVNTPVQLEVPGICLAWLLFKALPLVLQDSGFWSEVSTLTV